MRRPPQADSRVTRDVNGFPVRAAFRKDPGLASTPSILHTQWPLLVGAYVEWAFGPPIACFVSPQLEPATSPGDPERPPRPAHELRTRRVPRPEAGARPQRPWK